MHLILTRIAQCRKGSRSLAGHRSPMVGCFPSPFGRGEPKITRISTSRISWNKNISSRGWLHSLTPIPKMAYAAHHSHKRIARDLPAIPKHRLIHPLSLSLGARDASYARFPHSVHPACLSAPSLSVAPPVPRSKPLKRSSPFCCALVSPCHEV
jgi:hypothetical protein